MNDVEKRLKALEKRARNDVERWGSIGGEIRAISGALACIARPICATNPKLMRTIVKNLKTYETVARMDNEHSQMIVRLRYIRQVFESQLKEIEGGADSGAPRPKK